MEHFKWFVLGSSKKRLPKRDKQSCSVNSINCSVEERFFVLTSCGLEYGVNIEGERFNGLWVTVSTDDWVSILRRRSRQIALINAESFTIKCIRIKRMTYIPETVKQDIKN